MTKPTRVLHPRDVKMRLARELVCAFMGMQEAREAADERITVFQQGRIPDPVSTVTITPGARRLVEALVDFALTPSRSEARRLVMRGGVQVNGTALTDVSAQINLEEETIIRVDAPSKPPRSDSDRWGGWHGV